jgi:hypothetical protein
MRAMTEGVFFGYYYHILAISQPVLAAGKIRTPVIGTKLETAIEGRHCRSKPVALEA